MNARVWAPFQAFVRRLLVKKHSLTCAKRSGPETAKFRQGSAATFDCDLCDSSFLQHSQLRVHKRMHSGERPYKCQVRANHPKPLSTHALTANSQVCWHSFAHSSVLKLHIRKHTGEKPFKCVICPDTTAFSQLPHLKTHMRTIHGMDKTYQCRRCDSFYKTKNEHQLHTVACTAASSSSTDADDPMAPDEMRRPSSAELLAKQQTEKLSQMRLCVAVLLKRITTADRLKQLGFEKVLIDNVIMAALKKADQPFECDAGLPDLERFCVNVRYFLEWTIPKNILEKFEHKDTNVKELLVKLTQTNDRT